MQRVLQSLEKCSQGLGHCRKKKKDYAKKNPVEMKKKVNKETVIGVK